eukprot:3330664-Pyramimonas_sp.AAC.1
MAVNKNHGVGGSGEEGKVLIPPSPAPFLGSFWSPPGDALVVSRLDSLRSPGFASQSWPSL